MSAYGYRDNKISTKDAEVVGELSVEKKKESKAVSYIKLRSCAVGTATSTNRYAYLYLGTGGALRVASTAPTGTTGAFANTGGVIATSV